MIADPAAKNDFYRRAANNFANSAIIRRYTATVHVEGESDISFWGQILHRFYPSGKFHFIYYSKSLSGNEASGSTHCMNYLPYLSKHFFICIDSDNRYLKHTDNLTINDFVFQTYAYSIENHYCYAPHLSYICKIMTGAQNPVFNFELFLKDYSNIVYPLFIWHQYFLRIGSEELDVIPFNNLITFKGRISEWQLIDNGKFILDKIQQRVTSRLNNIKHDYPDINIEEEEKLCKDLGVTPDTVYLFVRGHHLADFISKVGQICTDKMLREQSESKSSKKKKSNTQIKTNKTFKQLLTGRVWIAKYFCMNMIKQDIKSFFYTKKK